MKAKRLFLLAAAIVLLAAMFAVSAYAFAPVSYIDRVWDGEKIVETEKTCRDYTQVTFETVNLETGWYVADANWSIPEPMTVCGTVNLILKDGVTLTADYGIVVSEGNTLNIYGQSGDSGSLIAIGELSAAGIGGGAMESCGTVTVHGGSITATGDLFAAGIGGGEYGSGGTVTIIGGSVTATGGVNGAGIGGGECGRGGTVTINGGKVKANGMDGGAGIGGGDNGVGGVVTINGGTVDAVGNLSREEATSFGAGIGGGHQGIGGTVTVNGGSVTAIGGDGAAGIGGGPQGNGGRVTINGGSVTAIGGDAAGIGGGEYGGRAAVTLGAGIVIGYGADEENAAQYVTGETENVGELLNGAQYAKVCQPPFAVDGKFYYTNRTWDGEKVVSTPAVVTDYTVVTSTTMNLENGKWYVVCDDVTPEMPITVKGTANLIVADGATLTVNGGILVKSGNTLNVYSQSGDGGTVIATSRTCAGIGGTISGGEINVYGGNVNATARNTYADGIGISERSSGGRDAAQGGILTVYGGSVTATGGEDDGAGIGSNVIVYGGSVTAAGGKNGAGIGGGLQGNGGRVTVYGGTVTATSAGYGAGIGGGEYGNGGTVAIYGGTVTAASARYDTSIGGGYEATDQGTLTLGAGVVFGAGDDAENITLIGGKSQAEAAFGKKYFVTPYAHTHHGGTATCQKRAVCTLCGATYGDYAEHAYGSIACATCGASAFVMKNGVLTKYLGSGGDVVIPEGVTSIGVYAFCDCKKLTSILIPENVTSIGSVAFIFCEALTTLTVTDNIPTIAGDAFAYTGVSAVNYPCDNNLAKIKAAYGPHLSENATYNAMHGDSVQGDLVSAATCLKPAVYEIKCVRCSSVFDTVEVGELGDHSWQAATCTEPKTCSVCRVTEGDPLGHTWVEANCQSPKTCSVCHVTEGELGDHVWQEATCTEPKTCSVCHTTEGDPLGHDYDVLYKVKDAYRAVCTRCGDITDNYVPEIALDSATLKGIAVGDILKSGAVFKHDNKTVFMNTDCVVYVNGEKVATLAYNEEWTAKECLRCVSVVKAFINQVRFESACDYTEATCTEPATCIYCGATEGEALGHSFGEGVFTMVDKNTAKMISICSTCGEHDVVDLTVEDTADAKRIDLGNGDIAFLAGVDSIAYEAVGFDVTVNGTTKTFTVDTAYRTVTAGSVVFDSADFGIADGYVYGLIVKGIPENATVSFEKVLNGGAN